MNPLGGKGVVLVGGKPQTMTPIEIAVMATAHKWRDGGVGVRGSWHDAAKRLVAEGLLEKIGDLRSTGPTTCTSLHGKKTKKPAGTIQHLFRLAATDVARDLAARCARAVDNLPRGRQHATWRDVSPDLHEWTGTKRCPACMCTPDDPCTIYLSGDKGVVLGTGTCVPAGAFGLERCSACLPR